MQRLILASFCVSITTCCFAETPVASGYQDGLSFSNASKGSSTIKGEAAGAVTESVARTVSDVRYTAPEASIYQNGMGNAAYQGINKQTKCNQPSATWSDAEKVECDAVRFATKNPNQRPVYELDAKTDPVLISSKNIIASTKQTSDTAQNCRVVTKVIQAQSREEHCLVTKIFEEKKCQRRFTVSCNDFGGQTVGLGGIVKDSYIVSDGTGTATWISPNQFKVFQSAGGGVGYHNYSVTFEVKNKSEMKEFTAIYGCWDDYVSMKINGYEFYQRGGIHTLSSGENTLNIELLSYLNEGKNTIDVVLWNTKGPYCGGAAFKTNLKTECNDNWNDQCVGMGL